AAPGQGRHDAGTDERDQNGDDRHHDQQLHQGETAAGTGMNRPSHGMNLRVYPRPVGAGRAPVRYLLNPSSSLISGRKSAITIDPMMSPSTTIIKGSSALMRLFTSVSTSSS